MIKFISPLAAVKYVIGASLLLAFLVNLFKPAALVLLLLILGAMFGVRRHAGAMSMMNMLLTFVGKHAYTLLILQCVVYALTYNSLIPGGMYFSPDSVLYLSVSNIVPPTFALLARGLVELELAFGSARIVLMRYLVIAIYCLGGILLARALLKSGRPLLAMLVVPTLWSMSSLTQWFNYFLTDGIATAFLVACVGAYANLYVGICAGEPRRHDPWGWLALFVLFGMLSFSMRPAFAFVAPVMVVLMFNRAIFQWKRVAAVSLGVVLLAAAHFSFAYYWHGRAPSQMGGVLTALVFDLPIPYTCQSNDESDLCRTQKVLEPYIRASHDLGSTREQYVYKVLNNGEIVQTARAAVKDGDPNYSTLLDIALLKIKTNFADYLWMVLKNSYYSVKSWGDSAWNDGLGQGSVALVNIGNTNDIAPAVREAMHLTFQIDFDPTISSPPAERVYKNVLFRLPGLLLKDQVVFKFAPVILIVVIACSLMPMLVPASLPASILFACCFLGVSGTIFQNAFFPVIPRLLDPFHPLALLGVLMLLNLAMTASRKQFK